MAQKALPLLCALLFAGVLFGPAARAADYTSSIGMQFNNIPAGRFYMGSCKLSGADREADKKRTTSSFRAQSRNPAIPGLNCSATIFWMLRLRAA